MTVCSTEGVFPLTFSPCEGFLSSAEGPLLSLCIELPSEEVTDEGCDSGFPLWVEEVETDAEEGAELGVEAEIESFVEEVELPEKPSSEATAMQERAISKAKRTATKQAHLRKVGFFRITVSFWSKEVIQ